MNRYTKFLNVMVVAALLLSSASSVLAGPSTPKEPTMSNMAKRVMVDAQNALTAVASAQPKTRGVDRAALEPVEAEDVVDMAAPASYIIQLEDAPLATYAGGIGRMAATSAPARGERKLNVASPDAVIYRNYLQGKQNQFLTAAEKTLQRPLGVQFRYEVAYNGMAVQISAIEAAEIAKLPGVHKVIRGVVRYPVTDAGPTWIGAGGVWDGSAAYTETMGEGIVVGVIDTGVNSNHPSFAEVGPSDGYVHVNPLGDGVYLGLCDSVPTATFQCNNKLIGGYDFVDGLTDDPVGEGPEDNNGHGSHTSSTAAGNVLEDIVADLGTTTITTSISGVAPHANIIIYDACGNDDGCPTAATVAAIEQATANGVDVINYSIGGGPYNPWDDPDSEAFLAARNAGIYVSISAGNDGPGAGTVGSPANSPWVQTLGNATHNRMFANTISFSGVVTPLVMMSGASLSAAYGPAPIVHAGDFGDPLCGTPFAAGTWTNGEIVVCDRGQYALVDKVANVAAGGAGGVVIANAAANGETTASIPHELPSIHIGYTDAELLRAWLSSGSGHTATISASFTDVDDTYGDRMAAGSSRGPNLPAPDVIKPDLIAPGSDILAAYRDPEQYNVIGGTSMASPHGAGAGILMRALYPDWTESQIQSAIMSTAISDQALKEDWVTDADPFDSGNGRIFVSNAARAGFVLDETYDNFVNADPLNGGDPSTLNLASLGQDECLGSCTWQRTISSTLSYTTSWTASYVSADGVTMTVTPSEFMLAPYGVQELEIRADVSAFPVTETWKFAEVVFTPDMPDVSVAHFSVAVDPTSGVIPDAVEASTRRDAGSVLLEDLETIEVTALTVESFGLVGPTLHEFTLTEVISSTGMGFPAIFFQSGPGIEFTEVTVPADSARFVAEILDTTSPDLDMIVFRDMDDDGVPELDDANADPELCQSAAGGPFESCDIFNPTAGRWYVAVLDYTESATPPDDVTLVTAVVGADAGNFSVTGPTSVPAGELYDVRVYWDEPAMESGETWYGVITLGSDPAHPGNIGTIPVAIYREADDVVKTVEPLEAIEGDVVTFTITVEPNVTAEDLAYMITDTIPAGLSYVPDSLHASAGVASENAGVITWQGNMNVPALGYVASTSATDPNCTNLFNGVPGYVDLRGELGWTVDTLTGDDISWSYASAGVHEFYGVGGRAQRFTSNGYVLLGDTSVLTSTPQHLPDPAAPNAVAALLWQNLRIVQNATLNHGVTFGRIPDTYFILEYDDIQIADDPSSTLDMEIEMQSPPAAGPEIVFSFDNINGSFDASSIGIENDDGSDGISMAYLNADSVITDNLNICFDWTVLGANPIVITYQAEVEIGAVELETIINTAYHNTDNPGSMEAGADAALTVTGYTLTVDIVGEGSVTRTPDQVRFVPGAQVMLEAIPAEGWMFDNWNGSSLLLNPMTVTMNSDVVVTATFTALPTYTLDVNVVGNGSVAVAPEAESYYAGQSVQLTATSDPGWDFAGWTGDAGGADNPLTVVMDSDKVITATFTEEPVVTFELTVDVAGSGSVTKVPSATTYVSGTSVQLTAVPAAGWEFDAWSGDLTGTNNPATIVMNEDKSVMATFVALPTYSLDVEVVGEGSVAVDPVMAEYPEGTEVQLTATPATGWDFAGWSGDLTGMTNPATLMMNADTVVTATFTTMSDTYTLDVVTVGSGSVAADPNMTEYIEGTVVELTATPNQGWEFDSWSGDLMGTTNPAALTMTKDMVVTATFTALPTYTLDVNVVGNGSVTVAPDAAYYLEGASVQLTAVPATDWYFAGWTGDAGGADNPLTVVMDGNKVITVTFTEEPVVTVTLTVNVTGSGSVTKVPSATTYISGTSVQLTAAPATGWAFSAWSGDVVTTTNPISIIMDANKTVTAAFVEAGGNTWIYLPLVARQFGQ